ncbi:hypothetical protein [Streptomyces sp. NPDC002588]|uniref:hypothetical protein n=1 Tax=Streptomyces sp. NPDC002588 TaxID=3154419 RepID=UPI00332C8A7A
MTAGWCSRMLRAAMFAAVCVLLAALGHVLMSGVHVPGWALAAAAAATGGAGWCLAGRERGTAPVVAVVVAAQAALHSAFAYARPAGTAASMAGAATDSVRMAGMADMTDVADMAHSAPVPVPVTSWSGGMLAAHLLAALLCGLWLAYGEKAAFRFLRAVGGWLAAPLRLLLALPRPLDRPRVAPRPRGSLPVPGFLLVHAITSRGPPLGAAAA